MMVILTFILFFGLKDNPPGTIKIKDYYVDQTEAQNIHWLEYIYYRQQELDSIEVQPLLPDSSNFWYALHENRFKPIVLITQEQVIDYCKWRSKIVSDRLGKKITYRLPTVAEWKEIANEIIKTDHRQIQKDLKETMKLIEKGPDEYMLIGIVIPPNSRVYNMFDNVSEMMFEKGRAMGSNNYELANSGIDMMKTIKYDSPNSYIGFRCIAEIE